MNIWREQKIILVIIAILMVLLQLAGCPTLIPVLEVGDLTDTNLVLIGDSLQVGTIVPIGASVSYQWQRSTDESPRILRDTGQYSFVDIPGATDAVYETTQSDIHHFVRVGVTGKENFTGTCYSNPVEVLANPLIVDIAEIPGVTPPVAGAIPVGTITETNQYTGTVFWSPEHNPFRAATTYCATIELIPKTGYTCTGVIENFFTVENAQTVTNNTSSSTVVAVFSQTGTQPVNSIGPITGTAQVDETVTVGALTPGGATAAYSWLISNEQNSGFNPIPAAIQTTYTIKPADVDKFLKVQASGTNGYTGTVTSAPIGPIVPAVVEGIGNIIGTPRVDTELYAGTLVPAQAAVDYWWQSAPADNGPFTDIPLGNSDSYTLTGDEVGKYIRVNVEGRPSQGYTGTVYSAVVGPVEPRPLEAIGPITGNPHISGVLTAGAVAPAQAKVTYQWQICATVDGTYNPIDGETLNTYVVDIDDKLSYIRVQVTGIQGYEGVLTSAAVQIGYSVGDIGPAGGIIIMDKGVYDKTVGTCTTGYNYQPDDDEVPTDAPWRYLELAPKGWDGVDTDPESKWDYTEPDSTEGPSYGLTFVNATRPYIGAGKENTDNIIAALDGIGSAASKAREYGSEWFLPSLEEMKLVYSALTATQRSAIGILSSGYHTSSEISATQTWRVFMGDGDQYYAGWYKWEEDYVRPLRRF